MQVTFVGRLGLGPEKPTVIGDGKELTAKSVGGYGPTASRGALTVVTAELPDSGVPRQLIVEAGEKVDVPPPVEVVLR